MIRKFTTKTINKVVTTAQPESTFYLDYPAELISATSAALLLNLGLLAVPSTGIPNLQLVLCSAASSCMEGGNQFMRRELFEKELM